MMKLSAITDTRPAVLGSGRSGSLSKIYSKAPSRMTVNTLIQVALSTQNLSKKIH